MSDGMFRFDLPRPLIDPALDVLAMIERMECHDCATPGECAHASADAYVLVSTSGDAFGGALALTRLALTQLAVTAADGDIPAVIGHLRHLLINASPG